jgi:hypothetical protein
MPSGPRSRDGLTKHRYRRQDQVGFPSPAGLDDGDKVTMVARATRSRRTRARTRSATAPGRSTALNWAARIGLTARGIVYVLIGLLAFLLARGARGTHVDQKGALSELLSWSYGRLAVTALAIGFFCYAHTEPAASPGWPPRCRTPGTSRWG